MKSIVIFESIDDKILNYFNDILDSNNDNLIYEGYASSTIWGRQTHNLFEVMPLNLDVLTKLKEIILSFLMEKQNFIEWDDVYIDHIHLIEYGQGGYQKHHDHTLTEDFSFIIYLNDSDGDTVFYNKGEQLKITPKKSRMIVFDGHIYHYALKSYLEKRVAVGRIRLHNKRWK